MDGIKRVDRRTNVSNHTAAAEHKKRVQKSSTLNRRYVKRPVAKQVTVVADVEAAAPRAAVVPMAATQVKVTRPKIRAAATQRVSPKVVTPKAASPRRVIARGMAKNDAEAVVKVATVSKPIAVAEEKSAVKVASKVAAPKVANAVSVPKVSVKATPKIETKNLIRSRAGAVSVKTKAAVSGQRILTKQHSVKLQPNVARQVVAPVVKMKVAASVSGKPVVKKATVVSSQKVAHKSAEKLASRPVVARNQMAVNANRKLASMKPAPTVQLSSKQIKDRAVQQAFNKMNQLEAERKQAIEQEVAEKKSLWRSGKMALAGAMAVFSVAVLGYLLSVNMPDISVRVAAMQAGIERSYPNYVPMGFRLDGLVKEEGGRITMSFKDEEGKSFTLFEEKTAWDSSAVLSNYVKKNWGEEYSVARGQGLTIYIADSNAAWVNGGVLYVIENEGEALSSSDLHDIAVSLY